MDSLVITSDNVNLYSTTWGNRFVTRSLSNQQGVDGFQFKDIDVVHNGLEENNL